MQIVVLSSVLPVFMAALIAIMPISYAETKNNDLLTLDYFIPNPGQELIYVFKGGDGSVEEWASVWEELSNGQYKQTLKDSSGSMYYSLYQVENGEVTEIESGFWFPQSEYGTDTVIKGRNIVFKSVEPGSTWSCYYQLQDSWGSIAEIRENYKFEGFETLSYYGTGVQAAKITLNYECVPYESNNYAGWGFVSEAYYGENWYVKGLGLVKTVSYTDGGDVRHSTLIKGIGGAVITENTPYSGGVSTVTVTLKNSQGDYIKDHKYISRLFAQRTYKPDIDNINNIQVVDLNGALLNEESIMEVLDNYSLIHFAIENSSFPFKFDQRTLYESVATHPLLGGIASFNFLSSDPSIVFRLNEADKVILKKLYSAVIYDILTNPKYQPEKFELELQKILNEIAQDDLNKTCAKIQEEVKQSIKEFEAYFEDKDVINAYLYGDAKAAEAIEKEIERLRQVSLEKKDKLVKTEKQLAMFKKLGKYLDSIEYGSFFVSEALLLMHDLQYREEMKQLFEELASDPNCENTLRNSIREVLSKLPTNQEYLARYIKVRDSVVKEAKVFTADFILSRVKGPFIYKELADMIFGATGLTEDLNLAYKGLSLTYIMTQNDFRYSSIVIPLIAKHREMSSQPQMATVIEKDLEKLKRIIQLYFILDVALVDNYYDLLHNDANRNPFKSKDTTFEEMKKQEIKYYWEHFDKFFNPPNIKLLKQYCDH
ncbi:MAG: hypothetical protein RJR37_05875 [Peptococcaceae bacterium MAG4]|nr:hypothetical protein [Peptococcaceae bacterium MAG4]NLW38423.1 hypothetical protein [Peptococcaceae bacterium]